MLITPHEMRGACNTPTPENPEKGLIIFKVNIFHQIAHHAHLIIQYTLP